MHDVADFLIAASSNEFIENQFLASRYMDAAYYCPSDGFEVDRDADRYFEFQDRLPVAAFLERGVWHSVRNRERRGIDFREAD